MKELRKEFIMRKYAIRFTVVLVILVGSQLLFPRQSYAYLDPGTGSFIIQMLIATLVGGLFMIKVYFKKIKDFFKRKFSKGGSDEHSQGGSDEHPQE
jgi:hypothetical protein